MPVTTSPRWCATPPGAPRRSGPGRKPRCPPAAGPPAARRGGAGAGGGAAGRGDHRAGRGGLRARPVAARRRRDGQLPRYPSDDRGDARVRSPADRRGQRGSSRACEGPLPYRLIARPLLWRVLRAHYTDLAQMERLLRESGLDWTVVRPPRLTDGPATGRQRTALDGAVL